MEKLTDKEMEQVSGGISVADVAAKIQAANIPDELKTKLITTAITLGIPAAKKLANQFAQENPELYAILKTILS